MIVKSMAVPRPDADAPDAELVSRVLSGEVQAYAHLVERYKRPVWRVAVAMLADEATTENLVQQCFVDAYEHLSQYDRARPLGPWLKAIARNLVRMEMRRNERQHRLLACYESALATAWQDAATADEAEDELRDAIARCQDTLAPAAREALRLHYEAGKSLEAVAQLIGRTVVATRQLLWRARAHLRHCVDERLGHA